MKTLLACLLTAACLAPAARAATDETAAAKKICDQYKDAVIWLSAVAKISISASDYKTPMTIPDTSTVYSLLTISEPGSNLVTDINVQVRIIHTYDRDVTLALQHPDGTEVLLVRRPATSTATRARVFAPALSASNSKSTLKSPARANR